MNSEVDGFAPAHRLAKDSVGLAHIVFFVVAAAAPLTAVVGATPGAFAFGNGPGVPGAFILAGLLYLTFSVGFAAMSRYVGSAGGFYNYITSGLGRPAGVGGALMVLVTYSAVQTGVYALFGVFMAGAMARAGIGLPWWAWTFTCLIAVHFCGRRNIAFSGTILGICMIGEIAILLLLDIAILHSGGGPEGIGFSSFSPTSVFAPGFGIALVFVVGSFIGFEATVIFGEEVKTPERTIPRATYGAVLLITILYASSTWAIVQFYGPAKTQEAAANGLGTFYFAASDALLGGWATVTMNVLLITSLFACVLSFHNTLNRYFFALGREGLLIKALGSVHERHGSPYVAGVTQSASAAAILVLFVLVGADPYTVVFCWMSALAVIGMLTVQALVSVAIISFFRKTKTPHSVWATTLAPTFGLIGILCALSFVIVNLSLLSGSESAVVKSFPYAVVAVGLTGAAFAIRVKHSKPQLYTSLGKVFE